MRSFDIVLVTNITLYAYYDHPQLLSLTLIIGTASSTMPHTDHYCFIQKRVNYSCAKCVQKVRECLH